MQLPIQTTKEDVLGIIDYLKTKPNGVTTDEAKSVIDNKLLDSRKINGYKFWGIIEVDNPKLMLTDKGWIIARKLEEFTPVFRSIVQNIDPYFSVLEFAYFQKLEIISNVDVIVLWNKKYSEFSVLKETAKTDQAACFFRFCEAAGLGEMKVGRKGEQTRFALLKDEIQSLIQNTPNDVKKPGKEIIEKEAFQESEKNVTNKANVVEDVDFSEKEGLRSRANPLESMKRKVYITHGKNRSFINPIKELLAFGELEAYVSIEEQSVSKPVPEKVMDDMRNCGAAIIHVEDEISLTGADGKPVSIINPNVLIEIGAAMALYGKRFILVVKEGVTLPSNLQGLYEVRYSGTNLDGETTIKLMKSIKSLKAEPLPSFK